MLWTNGINERILTLKVCARTCHQIVREEKLTCVPYGASCIGLSCSNHTPIALDRWTKIVTDRMLTNDCVVTSVLWWRDHGVGGLFQDWRRHTVRTLRSWGTCTRKPEWRPPHACAACSSGSTESMRKNQLMRFLYNLGFK